MVAGSRFVSFDFPKLNGTNLQQHAPALGRVCRHACGARRTLQSPRLDPGSLSMNRLVSLRAVSDSEGSAPSLRSGRFLAAVADLRVVWLCGRIHTVAHLKLWRFH
jgi:hypothetical protein